jgi:hypothetical protein
MERKGMDKKGGESKGAEKGGFKLSFAGAKKSNALKPSGLSTQTSKKKALLGDDEPEDNDKSVEISGFDAATGGAIDLNGKKKEDAGPRIIPALPNRNWREEAQRKQAAKAAEGAKGNGGAEQMEASMAFGLTIIKKKEEAEENGVQEETAEEKPAEPVDDGLTEEQRLEKRALEALINGKEADNQLVIPVQTDDEIFQNDYRNAPEGPDLAAFEATPIEGFGAALLRGMGWKDGEEIGRNKGQPTKSKEVKRRPALLGIGAKEEAAVGIELGDWGSGKGKGKRKIDESYNPVVKRHKVTGELISEEELQKKIEAQTLLDEEEGKKKTKKSGYDDYELDSEDERRRERKRKERKERERRDRSGDRDSRRRDRSRDKDDRRDRDRRRDDDYDSRKKERRRDDYSDDDRRREKRRERDYPDDDRKKSRRREDDYDSERRRDKRRERDYSDDERRSEKRRDRDRRDRDRSRSRDSQDSRKRRRDYEDERDDRKRRHKSDRYDRK